MQFVMLVLDGLAAATVCSAWCLPRLPPLPVPGCCSTFADRDAFCIVPFLLVRTEGQGGGLCTANDI